MKRRGVAGLVGLAGLTFPLGLVVIALSGAGGGAGCSAAPDFVPFVCGASVEGTGVDGGDGGDGGDSGDAGDATSPIVIGTAFDAGDADADAAALPTPYFYARQITAAECTIAAISWIQCDDGIYARYFAVDSGALTVDYYKPTTGALVAEVLYSSPSSAGKCTAGPTEFTPPGCGGSQVVCCPYNPDAGDGGDADAEPDSGCGF